MKTRIYSLMLISAISFLGCGSGGSDDTVSFPVEFKTVSKFNTSEKSKRVEVFRNNNSFEKEYIDVLSSNTFDTINFKENAVIAANTDDGCEIEINNVKEYRNCIEVGIKTKMINEQCNDYEKTNTAHIITMPNLDHKDIVIKEEEVITICNDDGDIKENNQYACDTEQNKKSNIKFYIIYSDTVSADIAGHKLFQTFYQNTFDLFEKLYIDTTGELKAPDFTGTMILLRSGFKNTGGYTINVESIEEFEDFIKVNVISTSPGKNCLATMELTNPYIFINTPDIEYKNIIFCETQKVYNCEGSL